MLDDGEFVVCDKQGRHRFSTNTAGRPGAHLRCQDDRNVVMHVPDPDLRVI